LSETTVFELLGFAGIAIGVSAYIPQVVHLVREQCSAGVSGGAWAMWLTSSMLIGALALHRRDPVFIALQASSLSSTAAILLLAYRYRGMLCESHAHLRSKPSASARSAGDADGVTLLLHARRRARVGRAAPSEERMGVRDE
jgi:lipid-A-disaccharide synthase-like uncharacterized protein